MTFLQYKSDFDGNFCIAADFIGIRIFFEIVSTQPHFKTNFVLDFRHQSKAH
jgi:hypothetical protein